MGVDVVFLGGIVAGEDARHVNAEFPDRKLVADLDVPAGGHRTANNGRILMLLKLAPIPRSQFKVAYFPQLLGRNAVEHYYVQAGPAVVGKHLNGHHFTHAVQLGDPLLVILRQFARRGAELVRLKRNQRPLRLLPSLQVVHAFLNGADKAEDEQGNG